MRTKALLCSLAAGLLLSTLTVEAGIFDRFKKKKKETKKEISNKGMSNEILPEEGASLRVWEGNNEIEFMEHAARKFTEETGIPVTFEMVKMEKTVTRLAQDGPAGIGADVIVFPHDRLGEAITSGLIMENLVSADRVRNDFMDAATIAATYDGKIMAWPISIETYALYYNKDLLPEAPKSFEQLIEFGKTYTNRKENKYGIFWEVGNAYYNHAFLAIDGGYVFGNNGSNPSDIGLNNSGAIKGLDYMLKLKEISVEKASDVDYASMMGLFQEGKVAAIINGPWAIPDLKEAGVNFGIAPLPTFDGKHPRSFSGIRLVGTSTYSKYPKAAQLFAKFLTSDRMLLERFEYTKQIPPVKSLTKAPQIANNAEVIPFLEQAKYAVPMPAIPEIKYMWDPVGAALSETWDGKTTSKEALDTAVSTMREAIETSK